MQKFFIILSVLISFAVQGRQLTQLEIGVIKTQTCQNGDDSILRSLDINDGAPAPAPACKYVAVFCRTADKNLNRVNGPRIPVAADCKHKKALYLAIDTLWNKTICGGVMTDRCVKPATCIGIDPNGYQTELGRSYQFPDDAERF